MTSGPTSCHTAALGRVRRQKLGNDEGDWWKTHVPALSTHYKSWGDCSPTLGPTGQHVAPYRPRKSPSALALPRRTLADYVAMKTAHGDFALYHREFNHLDALTGCSWCREKTSADHLVHCRHSRTVWHRWPWPEKGQPLSPPEHGQRVAFLKAQLLDPQTFCKFALHTAQLSGAPTGACKPPRRRLAKRERPERCHSPLRQAHESSARHTAPGRGRQTL